MIIPY